MRRRTVILSSLCVAIIVASSTAVNDACPLRPIALYISNCTIPPTPDVPSTAYSWGIRVTVGSPPQDVCLGPSTVVNNTIFVSTDARNFPDTPGTTEAQLVSRRGGLISLSGSSLPPVSPGILASDGTFLSFNPSAFTNPRNASLSFKETTTPPFPVAFIANATNSNAGQLGLANSSTLLHTLFSAHLIPSLGWGLNVGSQSVPYPRPGSLVLGGYDDASIAGAGYTYPIKSGPPGAGSRSCPLQVRVSHLVLKREGIADFDLISEGEDVPACIEPYDSRFRLPRNVINLFRQTTGYPNITGPDPSQLLDIEPGIFYPSTAALNGSFLFTLDSGQTVEVPEYEIFHPLVGLDRSGERVVSPNVTEVNIFNAEAPQNTAVLGRAFLSILYLAVNTTGNSFTLFPAITDQDITPNPALFSNSQTSPTCTPSSSSLTKTRIIVGGVVGTVLGLALFALVAWVVYRFPRRGQDSPPEGPDNSLVLAAPAPLGDRVGAEAGGGPPAEMQDLRPLRTPQGQPEPQELLGGGSTTEFGSLEGLSRRTTRLESSGGVSSATKYEPVSPVVREMSAWEAGGGGALQGDGQAGPQGELETPPKTN